MRLKVEDMMKAIDMLRSQVDTRDDQGLSSIISQLRSIGINPDVFLSENKDDVLAKLIESLDIIDRKSAVISSLAGTMRWAEDSLTCMCSPDNKDGTCEKCELKESLKHFDLATP